MTAALEALRAADVLSALDVQTARTLGRLAGESDERVLIALALVSRQAQRGHVCLELSRLAEQGIMAEAEAALGREPWPSLEALRAALRASPLVGASGGVEHEARPVCLDAHDRLYLRRLYDQERSVATAIGDLASSPAERVDEAVLHSGLERLFGAVVAHKPTPTRAAKRAPADQLDLFGEPEPAAPPPAVAQAPDAQRSAAEHAVRHRFSVVSGGPGTGKTFTVVKMLALLVEQARALGQEDPLVLLLAPTGKAAARLSESVRKAKALLRCEPSVIQAITDKASTLHRALGVRRQQGGARSVREPLAARVIVVDEASMVDLGLMERLLVSVPDDARLILLGDKDQLASVEAGAVLGDICGEAGEQVAASPIARSIARSITTLTRSHRFSDDSAIKRLAEAIRQGDCARVFEVLHGGADEVQLREPQGEVDPRLLEAATASFGPLFAGSAAERISALDRYRVLCAHRHGPSGVIELNRRIEQALRRRGVLLGQGGHQGMHYAGRPILITENSYDNKLWNGDVGVLAEDTEQGLRACFADPEGVRRLPLSRLPAHESVYAMSVHKSQGSEVDEVAVVLPNEDSPLLSRELLYTAVTRARQRVVIYAPAATLKTCVERRVSRASGLREALWSVRS
jgi:exodeoxyribonuclease V alpha subunit